MRARVHPTGAEPHGLAWSGIGDEQPVDVAARIPLPNENGKKPRFYAPGPLLKFSSTERRALRTLTIRHFTPWAT